MSNLKGPTRFPVLFGLFGRAPDPGLFRAARSLALVAIAALIPFSLAPAASAPSSTKSQQALSSPTPASLTGVFKSYLPGTSEIMVALEGRDLKLKFDDASPESRRLISKAQVGDAITMDVDDSVEPQTAKKLGAIKRPVSSYIRLIALGGASIVAFLVLSLATRSHPLKFAIGADGRYSNSQTQLFLWFTTFIIVYMAAVALRMTILGLDFVGGVGITANLAALTGLSALSFGGAKVITQTKLDSQVAAGGPPTKTSAASSNILTDLFTNDNGQADLGDFQMIAITLLTVTIFLVAGFNWLGALTMSSTVTLPDIDSSLLTGFGVGQGAYLVKKAALKVGEG